MSISTAEIPESGLLRAARAGLYLTLAALPLYTVRWHYGPVPTTLLETAILMTLGIYLVARVRARDLHWERTPYDIPAAVLLAAGAISIFVAPDHRGALGLFRAYFVEPVLLFYVAIDLLRRTDHLKRLAIAFAVGSSAFALLNLYVFYKALIANAVYVGTAPNALYGDANYVAMYMEPPFAIAAGLVLLGQGWRWRGLGLAWLAVTGAAIVASFSKGAYMAVVVLAVVVVITVPRWRWALGLAVAASVVIATQIPYLMARLATVASSLNGRSEIFSASVQMLRNHPLLGVGLGGFTYQFRGVTPEIYPHDWWLTFWVEIGLAGVIAFGVILLTLLWRGWRAWNRSVGFERALLWGALGGLGLWAIHGFVDSPYWKNDTSAEFWLLAAIIFVVVRATLNPARDGQAPK